MMSFFYKNTHVCNKMNRLKTNGNDEIRILCKNIISLKI